MRPAVPEKNKYNMVSEEEEVLVDVKVDDEIVVNADETTTNKAKRKM